MMNLLRWVSARTIRVDTAKVSPFDFGLDRSAQELLYRNGREAAERFLATWHWDKYRERFRRTGLHAEGGA